MIFGDWAFLIKTTRLATAKALSVVEVAAIPNTRILDMEAIPPKVSLKIILNLGGLFSQEWPSHPVSFDQ